MQPLRTHAHAITCTQAHTFRTHSQKRYAESRVCGGSHTLGTRERNARKYTATCLRAGNATTLRKISRKPRCTTWPCAHPHLRRCARRTCVHLVLPSYYKANYSQVPCCPWRILCSQAAIQAHNPYVRMSSAHAFASSRAFVILRSHSRMRQPASIVASMRHVRDKFKCTQHTRQCEGEW